MTLRHPRSITSLAAVAVLLTALSGCAVADRTGGGRCHERAPWLASRSARAYVKAVDAAQPGWVAVSDRIRAHGNQMDVQDYRDQVAVDERFVADLRAIEFTGKAQADATRLEDALDAYIDFVRTSADQPGYLSAHRGIDDQVNDQRAEASAALRRSLHLPPNGCVVERP